MGGFSKGWELGVKAKITFLAYRPDFLKIHFQGLELDIYYLQYGFAIELVWTISFGMEVYLENACKYVGPDNLHPEKAILSFIFFSIKGIPAANEKEEYGQDLDFDGVDYDLNYTENTGYLIKRIMRQSKIQRTIGNIFIFQWSFLVGRIKGQIVSNQ
ncbi:hypothetical protein C1646_661946 [Rhizophagus diaphanus]|nr:hypothetical protein C1646_661946 [Rhizophagus diaphanus] [Rhizophagus sp. MUCL 43196]